MFGFDEGKAVASACCSGRRCACVDGREFPPPAGSGGRAAATAQSPSSDRRERLADVGRHSTSAGPGARPGHPGRAVRAWSAGRPCRSRSRASWASRRRRSRAMHAADRRRDDRVSLTFGTNRELAEIGRAPVIGGDAPPRLMWTAAGGKWSSRRRARGVVDTRRRDARPIRSGGRRGRMFGAAGRPCQAALGKGGTTRTSCRSGRSSATGTTPAESRSMAMARSVVRPRPRSRREICPLDRRPN